MDDSNFASNEKLATFLLESAGELSNLFQTLSSEKRVEILANLVFQRQSLADLQELTGFQASMLGNHLNILLENGMITRLGRGSYDVSTDGLELLQQIGEVFLQMKIREKQRLEYLQGLVERYASNIQVIHKGDKMNKQKELNVRIVELAEFSYVSFQAIGRHPEPAAFTKMTEWAKKQGYLEDMADHPLYGFNNPNPQQGKEEYGYEVWMQVNPSEVKDEEIEIKQFPGGKFAVTTTKLFPLQEDGVIPAWPRLGKWDKENGYKIGSHHWLEKALTPFAEEKDAYLDLYFPIE